MNAKQVKKLRQLYRRDLAKHAEKRAETIDEQLKEFTEKLDIVLKPAPKFMPEFMWVSLQKIFLNI